MGDWASLPRDVLDSIFDKLVPSVVDSILEKYCMSFSGVCTEWRSVACEKLEQLRTSHKRHCPQYQHVPLLAVPTRDDRERRSLYDIITRKTLGQFQFRIPLDTAFCGSSHGWLILLNKDSYKVTLFNPFSKKVIDHLPRISPPIVRRFGVPFLRGALSTDPDINRNEYALMLINDDIDLRKISSIPSTKIAFIRSGDQQWRYYDPYELCRDSCCLNDVIYNHNNGLFYVIDTLGMLLSCDVSSGDLKVRRVIPPDTLQIHSMDTTWLVESPQGDLLRVVKILTQTGGNRRTMTTAFVIYKLVCSQGIPTWTEVKSLGDVALFLGHNLSISVTASDFVGCQSNSIYFCGLDGELICSVNFDGVFNLQDGTMTPLHLHWERSELQSERLQLPMFWVLPPWSIV